MFWWSNPFVQMVNSFFPFMWVKRCLKLQSSVITIFLGWTIPEYLVYVCFFLATSHYPSISHYNPNYSPNYHPIIIPVIIPIIIPMIIPMTIPMIIPIIIPITITIIIRSIFPIIFPLCTIDYCFPHMNLGVFDGFR